MRSVIHGFDLQVKKVWAVSSQGLSVSPWERWLNANRWKKIPIGQLRITKATLSCLFETNLLLFQVMQQEKWLIGSPKSEKQNHKFANKNKNFPTDKKRLTLPLYIQYIYIFNTIIAFIDVIDFDVSFFLSPLKNINRTHLYLISRLQYLLWRYKEMLIWWQLKKTK